MIDNQTISDIELDKVLDIIRRFSLSPEGRETISAERISCSHDEIEKRSDRVARYISLIGASTPEPFPYITDIFDYSSHTHADFPGEAIHRAGEFIHSYKAMLAFENESERLSADDEELSADILSSIDAEGEVYENHPRLLPLIAKREKAKNERMRFSESFMRSNKDRMQLSEPLYRNERIVIPIKSDQKMGDIYVSGTSASGSTLLAEPFELVSLNNEVVIAEERIRAEKARILHELSDRVRAKLSVLSSMLDEVVEFDFHYAFALWAKRAGAVHPESSRILILKDARHPLLGDKAVPITLELDGNVKAVVLSGANAGGKTVTMKTVALLSALYQIAGFVTASRDSAFPIFSSFYADIGDGQSILDAASTFSSHMRNIAKIARRCDRHSLVILDELGSGTDPEEGSALSVAVLRYLSRKAGLTLITSHYSAVKSFAYSESGMLNASMEFDEKSGMPTYRVLEGIPGDSYALSTAKRMNMPEEILENASEALRGGDATSASIIKALISKERALDRKITELSLRNREAEHKLKAIEEKERELAEKENELRKGGVKEIDEYLRSSRKALERLISDIRTGTLTKEKIKKAKAFEASIEEKKREEETLIKEKEEEESDESFSAGDDVLCGTAKTPGKVIAVNGSNLTVSLENGLRLTIKSSMARKAKKAEPSPSVTFSSSGRRAEYTLDFRGLTLEEAQRRLDDQIEAALLSSLSSFSIIHGYGDGILQKGIHEYLKKRKEVADYRFARPEDGGMGKTYVTLSF